MIPLAYNTGNLRARRVATALTVIGIGVVIAVMLAMMALYNGVVAQLVTTGSKDLLLAMRDGSDAELSSSVTKEQLDVMRALPGVAAVSPQLVTIFKLPNKDGARGANVTMRGVAPNVFALRPYVRIVEGRAFNPGVHEVIVSRRIRDRFAGLNAGDTFNFGPQTWTVVGIFDAAGTAFDSEMWSDVDVLMQARKRESYSSVLVKPVDRAALPSVASAILGDLRLQLGARTEAEYYADQTRGLNGIKRLVQIVTFFMAGAAIFGTMNTMFSAVASRGRELATLRALGFPRRAILLSMLFESAVVALLGGLAGVLLSLPVNAIRTGTFNPQTMSEVAFTFHVDGRIAAIGIVVALVAGMIGGIVPALAAAATSITKSLREI